MIATLLAIVYKRYYSKTKDGARYDSARRQAGESYFVYFAFKHPKTEKAINMNSRKYTAKSNMFGNVFMEWGVSSFLPTPLTL